MLRVAFVLRSTEIHPVFSGLSPLDSSHLSLCLSLSPSFSPSLPIFFFLHLVGVLFFFLLLSSRFLSAPRNALFCFSFVFLLFSSRFLRKWKGKRERGRGSSSPFSFTLLLSLLFFSPLWGLPFPFRTIPPLRSWAFFSPFFLQFGAFPFLSFPSLSGFTPLSLSGFPSPFCFHFRASGFPCPFELSFPFFFFLVGFPSPFQASPFPIRLFLSLFYSVFPIIFRAFSFHFRPLLLAFPFRALPCPFSLFPFLLGLSLPFFIPLLAFPSCF